ncbi:MAG: SDR family oxidoreductase [Kofleriaceae bacterium]|nr:SDR family oxidoreductase [Kofleriaceae bacterium]MCB9571831.1 SDR family oxidoreductase [Kofleriaceae bacterium]
MATTILFTGFPGFLGRELLPRVLARDPATRAVCLVQAKFADAAAAAVAELAVDRPELAARIALREGDITAPDLGLGDDAALAADTVAIYHLAAIYDLSVPRAVAERVNVDGTQHVLDFAARCPSLERLHYVSTCYVSGRYTGIFEEDDLDKGQAFNNFYEETKFLAEVLVREAMARGLPATVYRPAIVVGDSQTGATQKLDGPYYILRWLLRQPRLALLPVIGDPSRFRINVVPRDYVVDAIAHLSGRADTVGRTFALADPEPPTCEEALEIMAAAAGRRVLRIRLPVGLAKALIDHVPGVYRLLQIPSSLVDYMAHPTHYHSRATAEALAPAGIEVPRFAGYAPAMAAFVRGNLALTSSAMA